MSDVGDQALATTAFRIAETCPIADPSGTFEDDDANVHEGNIGAIAAAGITLGCETDRFCPDDPVTRAQMASFLVRGFSLPDATAGDRFVDDDGSVHEPAIDALSQAGVPLGCNPPDNDRYCPQDLVARDQMASFLGRALDLEPRTPPPATAGTDDRMSDPFPGENPDQLVEVRVGAHGFFDRVVFEFENDLPGWSTMLEDPPLFGGTTGMEIDIEGNAFISVVFNPAAARYAAGTYEGPDRIEATGVVVTEVVEFDDFEGVNSWAVGLTDDAAYTVGWLDDPARFAVDVMHG